MTIMLLVPLTPSANTEITVYIDGQKQRYDQPPIIQNGSTLVPSRGIFEALGSEVKWDDKTQTVTANKDCINVWLKIGSKYPKVNGNSKSISVPAQILKGRTFVPLRFIGEALGANVVWDGVKRTITITSAPADCNNDSTTNQKVTASILSVIDGDTVKINLNGKEETV